jgi:hypothetical protein
MEKPMRRRLAFFVAALTAAAVTFLGAAPAQAAPDSPPGDPVQVYGTHTTADRVAVASTGAYIDHYEHGVLYVYAKPKQVQRIRALGFQVGAVTTNATLPPVDPGYHTYPQMVAAVDAIVAAHPTIAAKSAMVGKSFQNRDMVVLKISDNVATDENEPEVLFMSNIHAREHLTVEMALYLATELTGKYGIDPRITDLVNTREIWIVPMLNPDGAQFDLTAGPNYQDQRKNMQPNGTSKIGTDINRNFGYKWGCCGGSSPYKSSDTYRGTSAWSTPEATALRDWILSRRVGGQQQIKEAIDIHTYGELVMWPFGYTFSSIVTGMTQDQYDTHKAIGTEMAMSNGYWPGQGSGLYITSGDTVDWMWGDQQIFSFTWEMFPKSFDIATGFYPPASVAPAETSRNRDAALRFLSWADCPYRAIGKENTYCAATDDFTLTPNLGGVTVTQGSSVDFTVAAAKTAGADQGVTLEVTDDIPPNTAVSFTSAIQTDGVAHTVTVDTSADTTPGVYTIVVNGTGASAGTVRAARVQVTVVGTNANCAGTNGSDVPIPDGSGSAVSQIAIAGCGGNGGPTARVDVNIVHPVVMDLIVTLISPTGTRFPLHERAGDEFHNIVRSYTVGLSGEAADGAWSLEVQDVTTGNNGGIDSWSLTLK